MKQGSFASQHSSAHACFEAVEAGGCVFWAPSAPASQWTVPNLHGHVRPVGGPWPTVLCGTGRKTRSTTVKGKRSRQRQSQHSVLLLCGCFFCVGEAGREIRSRPQAQSRTSVCEEKSEGQVLRVWCEN